MCVCVREGTDTERDKREVAKRETRERESEQADMIMAQPLSQILIQLIYKIRFNVLLGSRITLYKGSSHGQRPVFEIRSSLLLNIFWRHPLILSPLR